MPHSSSTITSQLLSRLVAVSIMLSAAPGRADTLIYLTAAGLGEGATPTPSETLKFLPGGGSFHIWVQPDAEFTGISLDIDRGGSAIRFTGSTVHNPTVGSDTRWLPDLIRDGTVTDGKVSRIEGGALAPLTGFGTGIGSSTSSSDPLYEASGGFLFATIDFEVPSPTETATTSLAIGHNLLSDTGGLTTSNILLGVGDGPVANSPGATGTTVDLSFEARPLHPTDFDVDGDVDGTDLLTWQDGFGITSGATRAQGDGTGDGKVDGADLSLWTTQYGTVPPGALTALTTVPEPTSVCLFASAILTQMLIRQRR